MVRYIEDHSSFISLSCARIDFSSLIVIEGKIYRDLYIDELVICSDGNLLLFIIRHVLSIHSLALGFEVCKIDGGMKLDVRKPQVCTDA